MTSPHPTAPSGVILVLRTDDRRTAENAARAAAEGGIDAVEITLTVPDAIGLIAELQDLSVPVGVGTVLTAQQVTSAVAAGAAFVVSPNTDHEVMAAARELGAPMIPGALTPTEIQTAHRMGAAAVKVFPAGSLGGPQYLRELTGPLPHITYVASGGVSADNAGDYFAAGAHAVCIGRSIFPSAMLERGDLIELAERARSFMAPLRR